MVWAVLVMAPLAAQEDCGDEWRIRRLEQIPRAEADSGARTTIDVDIASNARIVSVVRGELWFTVIGAGSEATLRHANEGRVFSASLATSESGVSSIVYTQRAGGDPEAGREVFLVETLGGSFSSPRNISRSPADDREAELVLDGRGEAHVAWARTTRSSSQVLYWNTSMGAPSVAVAQGDNPAIRVDRHGVVHIACVQDGDILYANNATGTFAGRVRVTDSPLEPKSSVSIGVLDDGTVLMAYESGGSLYLSVRDLAGTYRPPRLVVEDGVLAPRMRLESGGRLLLVYGQSGGMAYVLGEGTDLAEPRRVAGTEGIEDAAALDVDGSGHLHASFIQGGAVNYGTNACAPVVDFSADVIEGHAPLAVRFTDSSSGAVGRWEWDFGDGSVSRLRNPTHEYHEVGEYTVRLTVWGPGGTSSRKAMEHLIVVQDPLYSFRIPDQQALPGTKEMWIPVLATSAEPTEGFQVVGTYDPEFLTLSRSDLRSTALSANQIEPEFVETRVHDTFFEIGVVLDFVPPFGGLHLPPIDNQRLIHLVFDVADTAPQGAMTRVELVNDEALSPIRNMMAVDGQARIPALSGSEVRIRAIGPPFPRLFVRGDFDSNGQVNLTDAVAALGFLFQGGSPPACPDAADVTDSGSIAITSVVALLNFLFTAGPAPAVPYPNPGLDPTDDALGECLTGE